MLTNKYNYKQLLSNLNSGAETKIGFAAIFKNAGIRNDGSMSYGNYIQRLINNDSTLFDYNFRDTYQRIKDGNRRFEFSKTLNPKTLEALEKLLSY